MGATPTDLARQAMELFNRDFGEMPADGVPADTRAIWVDEPVIVPLRAALEGTVYSGPDALDRFFTDSAESWEWLRIDPESFEDAGNGVCIVTATLIGCGRATGAETSMTAAFAIEVVSGRIAAARVFPSREAALEGVAR